MRIAHVITRLILGGAQENTVLCCRDLIHDYGDDVLLITGPPLGPEGSLLDDARRAKIPTTVIDPLRRPINPWRDLSAYHAIKRAIRDFQPDVVHTHSAKGGMLGRYAASALNVPAIVHTVHGAPFHEYQPAAVRGLFQLCERRAANKCHAFVSVADAMTNLMVAADVAPRSKFTTIYSGMDVEHFLRADEQRERVRSELGYSGQHVVIGTISRLFRLKGHRDIIEAARYVVKNQPNVRFLFVGDGVLRDDLERKIASAGLKEYFRFAGLVPAAQVPNFIGAMDFVVHTSLREGLARALPQALIAGRPVISYDIDGAREVVVDDETGYLVQPRDMKGLVEAIERLAADAALREQLGATGQARCREVFRHEHMTRLIRALYVHLIESNGQ